MTLQNTVNQTAYEQQISASLSSGAGQCRAEVECVCEPSYWVLEWRRQEGPSSLLGHQSQESFIFKPSNSTTLSPKALFLNPWPWESELEHEHWGTQCAVHRKGQREIAAACPREPSGLPLWFDHHQVLYLQKCQFMELNIYQKHVYAY